METNETYIQPGAGADLILNQAAQSYLREAGKWAAFLGILGFIGSAIIFLLAIFAGAIIAAISRFAPNPSGVAFAGLGGVVGVFYFLIALFYFFFSLYLYQFGTRIKRGILAGDADFVTNASGKLKSFFKLWGITAIVILSLYVLMVIFALILGVGAASLMNR